MVLFLCHPTPQVIQQLRGRGFLLAHPSSEEFRQLKGVACSRAFLLAALQCPVPKPKKKGWSVDQPFLRFRGDAPRRPAPPYTTERGITPPHLGSGSTNVPRPDRLISCGPLSLAARSQCILKTNSFVSCSRAITQFILGISTRNLRIKRHRRRRRFRGMCGGQIGSGRRCDGASSHCLYLTEVRDGQAWLQIAQADAQSTHVQRLADEGTPAAKQRFLYNAGRFAAISSLPASLQRAA